jgi:hypothetical protein
MTSDGQSSFPCKISHARDGAAMARHSETYGTHFVSCCKGPVFRILNPYRFFLLLLEYAGEQHVAFIIQYLLLVTDYLNPHFILAVVKDESCASLLHG